LQTVDPLDGVLEQLRAVFQLKFLLNSSAIGFDRLNSQMQITGDAPCPLTATDELKDFQLTVRQTFDGSLLAVARPFFR
jgi:hypothetical protein